MEGIRGIRHPLETPCILECIFSNLGFNDLTSCRRVCTTWREETAKVLKSYAKVDTYLNELEGTPSFFHIVENSKSTFPRKPFVDTFLLRKGIAESLGFWAVGGVHVKSLVLDEMTFESADAFRHIIFHLCSNLEELKLIRVKVNVEPAPKPNEWQAPQYSQNTNLKSLSLCNIDADKFNVGWLEIFSHFPCLEKLTVIGNTNYDVAVFDAPEIARNHDPKCWKLKEVTLDCNDIRPSFASMLGDKSVALTSLEISPHVVKTAEDGRRIQKILVANSDSLKNFELTIESGMPVPFAIFPLPGKPVFKRIEKLRLDGLENITQSVLQAFPNVRKLTLSLKEFPADITASQAVLSECTEFIFYNGMAETDDLQRVFHLIPNLKKLRTDFQDNEWFSLTCEHWPNLTHLELELHSVITELDDRGISGFDEKDVRKINRRAKKGRSWQPKTSHRRANLSSLKNLRSFSLDLSSVEHPKIGYCSFKHGILELPQLKHLQVVRGDNFQKEIPLMDSLLRQYPWDENEKIPLD